MISRASLALQVELDRIAFAKLRGEAARSQSASSRIAAIVKAAGFAAHTGTGVFRAPDLDHMLMEISDSLPATVSRPRNGVLHVMTQALLNGGHTRVVERWIEQDGQARRQTVVLTAQDGAPVPERLGTAVSAAGGEIVVFDERVAPLERAMQLRVLATSFDHVVTHAHMHDVVPALALGATDIPVIFYNHADHRFSIGMNAATVVAETRNWGKELSIRRRGILDTRVLGIPIRAERKNSTSVSERVVARQALDIPNKSIVAIAAGSAHKFSPMMHYDFFEFARRALDAVEDLHILVVGLVPQDLERMVGHKNARGRITLHPATNETGFRHCIAASDFAIDTFPDSGCTTLMDMVQAGIPVLSLRAPTGQMDYLVNLPDYCSDLETFLDRVVRFAESSAYREERYGEQFDRLHDEAGTGAFRALLGAFYDLGRTARVRPTTRVGRRDETASELDFLLALPRVHLNEGETL